MGAGKFSAEEIRECAAAFSARLELETWFAGALFFLPGKETPAGTENNDKQSRIIRLKEKVRDCRLCGLSASRSQTVFGAGNINADIVFVGEAPGYEEDLAGEPFVGAAGRLLTKIIAAMGLKREDVYITNALRCRPPHNRAPEPPEISACRAYLTELLSMIRPKVICALGRHALSALLEKPVSITAMRGKVISREGMSIVATFHPAYLLRNPADKKLVWQDMRLVMELMKTKSHENAERL